jgi:hypothetical protein
VDLYLHSPICLHGIYRNGFTFCRSTSVRYKDLPKFRIYTNINDLVRYPCVESDRKRVEWAAIPLYVEKLGRQFVGWEGNFVLLEAVCQQENMTDGHTVRFSMLYIQWAWLEGSGPEGVGGYSETNMMTGDGVSCTV